MRERSLGVALPQRSFSLCLTSQLVSKNTKLLRGYSAKPCTTTIAFARSPLNQQREGMPVEISNLSLVLGQVTKVCGSVLSAAD